MPPQWPSIIAKPLPSVTPPEKERVWLVDPRGGMVSDANIATSRADATRPQAIKIGDRNYQQLSDIRSFIVLRKGEGLR